ncbi:hypothetical protein QZH41_012673, partial [Actinostola sp. cb2023]
MIPEMACNENEKCSLNALRYAATVASNIFVFIVTWIMLSSGNEESNPNQLNKSDARAFTYVVIIVVGVGLFFVTLFHLGVKEQPRDCSHKLASKSSKRSASNWAMWFRVPLFYQTAIMYMCVRLIVNITQIYIPMYTLETLHLTKSSRTFSRFAYARKVFVSLFLELDERLIACANRDDIYQNHEGVNGPKWSQVASGSIPVWYTLYICCMETGAFVYGAMSFMDKMSNGIVVQIIQAFYPKSTPSSPNAGGDYYRSIMVFIAGSAAVIAVITLLTTYKTRQHTEISPAE